MPAFCGDQTLENYHSMVKLTGETGKAQSALMTDVEHAVYLISTIAAVQAVTAFTTGVVRGIDPITAFVQGFIGTVAYIFHYCNMVNRTCIIMLLTVIMVANVPQGLPSTVTAQLFIVAERMGAHNVFVKKLDVIETLGSCSMICTDKTGTLTQNLMTVIHLWTPKESLTAGEFKRDRRFE